MPSQTPVRRHFTNGRDASRLLVRRHSRGRLRARQVRAELRQPAGSMMLEAMAGALLLALPRSDHDADAAALLRAASEHFSTQMTRVSVVSLAGVALVYHGTVDGASRYWTGGLVLLAGLGAYGLLARWRLKATFVALFRREGYDHASAKARATAELAKITHRTLP